MDEFIKSPANLLSTINRITSLPGKYPFQRVLHCIVDCLSHTVPARCVAIVGLEPAADFLTIKASVGLSQQFINKFQRIIGSDAVGRMLRAGENIIANNFDRSSPDYEGLKLEHDYSSVIAARISFHAKSIGYIICFRDNEQTFLTEHLSYLEIAANVVSMAFRIHILQEDNKELTVLETGTGLYRLPYFCDRLIYQIGHSKNTGAEISLILVDIDRYKEFYRANGADSSAALLRSLIDITRKHTSGLDIIGRYGSDQIVVCLVDKNEEEAAGIAMRIAEDMYNLEFIRRNNPVSVGVYTCVADDCDNITIPFDRLGVCLVHAQSSGGNRVVRWNDVK